MLAKEVAQLEKKYKQTEEQTKKIQTLLEKKKTKLK